MTVAALGEVAATFLRLGCTSFGGPIAHLGYLRAELVTRRRWIDDESYGDIVALCQFLPGPTSSEVVFALGMHRAGLAGALLASMCFTLPSALLMLAFAEGVTHASNLSSTGWLHGLKLAAVAVVAQAVWGMAHKLCPDFPRRLLAIAAALLLFALPGAGTQLGAIAGGGLVGHLLYRNAHATVDARPPEPRRERHFAAAMALVTFALLLVLLPLLASATRSRELAVFDGFYRAGALVFGGGHVVLPLLRAELVPRGWLGDDQFLAGYAAAQALPGPLFSFAAYLGAAMAPGPGSWLHGVVALIAIFLPAWLLIAGSLPFWQRIRMQDWARAGLAGTNAAVVGVLLAALYNPVIAESVRGAPDAIIAVLGFVLLEVLKSPSWIVVAACAAAGQWLLPR